MEWLTPVKPGFGGFDEPYERANVVFVGVPLDITSSYRSGYRFGPARIREASANLETYLMAAGLDVFERLNISDLGDLEVTPTDLKATGERILRTVQKIKGDEKMPVLLGGEHTLTYFAAQAFDDVFVVQLDAHRDLRDEYLGDKICHATVMRRVLDFLPPERLVQVGVRSCSKEEAEFAREAKILAYSSEQVIDDASRIIAEVRKLVGKARVYLTIDLDVLDPAFAPGVATPEPGGPSTVEISRLVRELGKLNICAFDVVELVPPHDDGTAAFAAAKIIYELLAAIASSSK
ncbi:Guanidinobutyrase [subsurface metagenome]|nr:agmatinase [Hadesarchaea archaeon]TES83895.1 MAG: agmatinase [Hadesarchaea archaeon]